MHGIRLFVVTKKSAMFKTKLNVSDFKTKEKICVNCGFKLQVCPALVQHIYKGRIVLLTKEEKVRVE